MATLNQAARDLLESAALLHLVTINADGSPQVTCVWGGMDGDEIVTAHMDHRLKLANVERDPRVVVTVEAPDRNEWGLQEYLVVNGTGRVEEGGARELLQRFAHVYMGPDAAFPPPEYTNPGYVLRITPTRIGGAGPWT